VFRTIGTTVDALNVLNWQFGPLPRCAGLRGVRRHDLRRTRTILLEGRHVRPKPVWHLPRLLGHASITVTLDRYSHRMAGMGRRAADGV